ncbi:MAG: hypothetical protein LBJ11_07785 [Oscillospiraceae bacterium]|jgi:ketosteroid isomerase-like protein|nr:hypothetical protein [Oscillospiraceae bacterium]
MKKLNRGAVLTGLVLFCVIGYLAVTGVLHQREKPAIQAALRDYIVADSAARLLPESLRAPDAEVSDQALADCVKAAETSLAPFYAGESKSRDTAMRMLADALRNQVGGQAPRLSSLERTLRQITDFSFRGDTVAVTMQLAVQGEADAGGKSQAIEYVSWDNTVTFKKVDGEWKVLYAYLPVDNANGGMSALWY